MNERIRLFNGAVLACLCLVFAVERPVIGQDYRNQGGNVPVFRPGTDVNQAPGKVFNLKYASAEDIRKRFMSILPAESVGSVRMVAQNRSLYLWGPPNILRMADTIIPQMDSIQPGIAVGTIEEVKDHPALRNNGPGGAVDMNYNVPGPQPQNRTADYRGPTQPGVIRNRTVSEQRENPDSTEKAPLDAIVYRCRGKNLEQLIEKLRANYAKNPELSTLSLIQAPENENAKIVVIASETVQKEISEILRKNNILVPQSGNEIDPRIREGVLVPIEPVRKNRPVAPVKSTGFAYVPRNITFDRMESMIGKLLENKWTQLRSNDGNSFYFTSDRDGITRECRITFDRRNNRVSVNGDESLCNQFRMILSSVDRPQASQGIERRMITVRSTETDKIEQMIRIDREQRNNSNRQNGSNNNFRGTETISQKSPERPENTAPIRLAGHVSPFASRSVYRGQEGGGAPAGGGGGNAGFGGGEGGTGTVDVVTSDLNIQVIPDFDVIIFEGPGAEVARVMKMIETIQELSKYAEPQIEVFYLKNIDCLALSSVIEQVGINVFRTKQGAVTIFPMMRPNAVLIIGWGKALESMKDFIEVLDRPITDEQSTMRIVKLRYAGVLAVSQLINNAFSPVNVVGSGFMPRVQVFPDVRSNTLVIQGAPNDINRVLRIISEVDVRESGPSLEVRHFRLRYSYATDLGQTLLNIISPGNIGIGVTEDRKLPQFTLHQEGRAMIESGILSDVQIVPDVPNNSLIITAPSYAMIFLGELIDMLDVPRSTADIKVYRILYGDAGATMLMLQSIIPSQSGAGLNNITQLGAAAGEDSLIPLRFAVDLRTNSIIVTGSREGIKIVDSLILALDREDTEQRMKSVYTLRNSSAADVARSVNEYLRGKREIRLALPDMVSQYQQIEAEVLVVPEPTSNQLIIEATPRFFDEILEIVKDLDRDLPQVVIQVLIAEVTLGDSSEFGAEFGLQDSLLFNRSNFNSNGEINPGWNFNSGTGSVGNNYNGKSAESAGNVLPQMLTNFALKRANENGIAGMVFSASSDAVSILIRALQECNRLEVLSRPQITALDNQQAFILVGQRIPRIIRSETTSYGTQNYTDLENVGLILLVTPRINPNGKVLLDIGAEKSSVGSNAEGVPIAYSGENEVRSPKYNTITTKTTISANDNETVLLGGMITKEKDMTVRKVPLVADIPVIGKLFQYKFEQSKRTELLIIMTPKIIRDDNDFKRLQRVEAARMSWCLGEVHRLHGDTGLYDVMGEEPVGNPYIRLEPGEVLLDDLKEINPNEVLYPAPLPQMAPQIRNNGY